MIIQQQVFVDGRLYKNNKYGRRSQRQKHQFHNSDQEANSLSKHSPNFATQKLSFRILTNYWMPPGTSWIISLQIGVTYGEASK